MLLSASASHCGVSFLIVISFGTSAAGYLSVTLLGLNLVFVHTFPLFIFQTGSRPLACTFVAILRWPVYSLSHVHEEIAYDLLTAWGM